MEQASPTATAAASPAAPRTVDQRAPGSDTPDEPTVRLAAPQEPAARPTTQEEPTVRMTARNEPAARPAPSPRPHPSRTSSGDRPAPSGNGAAPAGNSAAPAGAEQAAAEHRPETAGHGPGLGADAPAPSPSTGSETASAAEPAVDAWSRPGDWALDGTEGPDTRLRSEPAPATRGPYSTEAEEYEDEWPDEYHDGPLFAAIFSAPSLALAAFVFALTGLLGGMIPESLPYLVQMDPSAGPAYHIRIVGLIALGFAIVAASLGLMAMLRSVASPLRWPTYLGGAAVLLALLIALQSVLLILLAGSAPEQPGF